MAISTVLTQAVPSAHRIAVLWDPAYPTHRQAVTAIESAARSLGVELRWMPASSVEAIEAAFAAMSNERAEAVLVLGTSFTYSNRARLAELALEHRLPSVLAERQSVEAGGLLSYSRNLNAMLRRCAALVDKILKGAKAAGLPVEQASTYELAINLKTARALGLTIPPEFLARADEVIE